MTTPKEGDVAFVHALAWFKCKCGLLTKRMTIAPVDADGRVRNPAEKMPGKVICEKCRDAEQAVIKKANREAVNQKSWQTRQKKKLATKKPGGVA